MLDSSDSSGPAEKFDGNVQVNGRIAAHGSDTDSLVVNGHGRFEGNVTMLGDITCSGNIMGNQNAAKTTYLF